MRKTLSQTILAAFCAILCTHLCVGGGGMIIGARTAAWAKSGGWVNPYITNGLIAMWDGEWNAGGGIHDPNATVWKDLVGGYDLINAAESPDAYWGEKCRIFRSGYGTMIFSGFDATKLSSGLTLEVVEEPMSNSATMHGASIYSGSSRVAALVRGNAAANRQIVGYAYGSSQIRTAGFGLDVTVSSALAATFGGSASLFKDGALKIASTSGSSQPTSGSTIFVGGYDGYIYYYTGKIFCVRLYSHALSDQEIAHNYNEDKSRFNLT